MADFDPYHKWLGIPPEEQPPHLYRLLGIAPFEDDADVISAAADQRMAHLRSFQTGQHGALSQKLLNEISRGRVKLLDEAKKTAYDAQLRAELAAREAQAGGNGDGDVLMPPGVAVGRPTAARPPGAPAGARPLPSAKPLPGRPQPAKVAAAALEVDNDGDDDFDSPDGGGDFDAAAGGFGSAFSGSGSTSSVRPRAVKTSSPGRTIGIIIGGIVGLGIGYSLLCNLRPGMDFLNIFPDPAPTIVVKEDGKSGEKPSVSPGDFYEKPKVEKKAPLQPKIKTPPKSETETEKPIVKRQLPPDEILAALPATVQLPELADVAAKDLLKFPGEYDAALAAFSVEPVGVDIPGGVTVLPEGEANPLKKWKLGVGEEKTPVASLEMNGRKLSFQWSPAAATTPSAALLSWCLMRIDVGGQQKAIPLRTVQAGPPITLEMKQRLTNHLVVAGKVPKPETVWLEISNLAQWHAQGRFVEGRTRVNFKSKDAQPVIIETAKVNKDEIPEIRISPIVTEQGLTVRIFRTLNTPGQDYELTSTAVGKKERETELKLAPAKKEYDETQIRGRNLQDELKRLENNRPFGTLAAKQWNAQRVALNTQIAAAKKKFDALDKKITPLQRIMNGIPEVKDAITALEGSKIEFRIVAAAHGAEIELYRTPEFSTDKIETPKDSPALPGSPSKDDPLSKIPDSTDEATSE